MPFGFGEVKDFGAAQLVYMTPTRKWKLMLLASIAQMLPVFQLLIGAGT